MPLSLPDRPCRSTVASTCIDAVTAPDLYHPPVKRSIEIAGHKTSISLEPLFWAMLRKAAEAEGLPLNALVARIDAERIAADTPPGLAGAIRLWLASRLTL
ncbi:aryl-sulfate sulfotransferase [Altererythrobacter xixiisoli]|uniref:Aryl-sulfate sulfotransferase n=1 Tax=Croceibacterium xixiisoli TaxID=1476466 RepID=A0A6I4TTD2_9SPHN|nr:aryl-sulfate sulfotransferase [Croceibacterium xixiisoli]